MLKKSYIIYVEKFRYVCFKKACRKHARDTYSYGPKSKRLFKRTVFSCVLLSVYTTVRPLISVMRKDSIAVEAFTCSWSLNGFGKHLTNGDSAGAKPRFSLMVITCVGTLKYTFAFAVSERLMVSSPSMTASPRTVIWNDRSLFPTGTVRVMGNAAL